jgi:hypothetical protein
MFTEWFLWILIPSLVCLFIIIVMFIIYRKCNMNSEDNNVTMPLMDVKVVSTKRENAKPIDMFNIKKAISNGVS